MAEPTLDAYLKALGFEDQSALAWQQAGQQQQMVGAQYDIAIPDLMRQTAAKQQGVTADALGRGIFSSGERQRNMADVNVAAQSQLGHLQLSRDQGLQSIAMDLARQQSSIDRGRNTAVWNWQEYERQKAEYEKAKADADARAAAALADQSAYYDWLMGRIPRGFPGGDPVEAAGRAYQQQVL